MASIIRTNLIRFFRSGMFWVLFALAMVLLFLEMYKAQQVMGFASSGYPVGVDSFLPVAGDGLRVDVLDSGYLLYVDGSFTNLPPYLRAIATLGKFAYIAMIVPVVCGSLFAGNIATGYEQIIKLRGYSERKLTLANIISVILFSMILLMFVLGLIFAISFIYCPYALNPLVTALTMETLVPFLPQVYAYSSIAYMSMFFLLVLGAIFLGLLSYLIAKITRNKVAASVVPLVLVWIISAFSASFPWWMSAYSQDSLGLMQIFSNQVQQAILIPVSYLIWIAILVVILCSSSFALLVTRKVSVWLRRSLHLPVLAKSTKTG